LNAVSFLTREYPPHRLIQQVNDNLTLTLHLPGLAGKTNCALIAANQLPASDMMTRLVGEDFGQRRRRVA
jgi:hypothetical protein